MGIRLIGPELVCHHPGMVSEGLAAGAIQVPPDGQPICMMNDRQTIGSHDLIQGRATHQVPIAPGGVLADYIPFYFTPYPPMLLNIVTGRNVQKRPKSDIVILVSSLPEVEEAVVQYLFSDRHAYLINAVFSDNIAELASMVRWDLLQVDWLIARENCEANLESIKAVLKQWPAGEQAAEKLAYSAMQCFSTRLPACSNSDSTRILQSWMDHDGVYGTFVISYNSDGRLDSVRKIADLPKSTPTTPVE